jgi:hypothetical protein
MHVPMWRMIIMLGCYPGNLFFEECIQSLHGLFSYCPEVQVSPTIFPFGIRAYDNTVKSTPLFSLINEAVRLSSVHASVNSKKTSRYFDSAPSWPLFNIPNGCLRTCPAFGIRGFDNGHYS